MITAVPFRYSGNNVAILWLIGGEAQLIAGVTVSLTCPFHRRKILCQGSDRIVSNCRISVRPGGGGNPIGRVVIELSISN